jgi:ABC-type multidrug transport system ATPase subunit
MKSDGITLAFKDVSYSEEIAGQHEGIDTFISPLVNAAKAVATCGKSNQSRTLFRVQDISGVIPPGSMTLIVAPPGHGKSTYLKLLGHRLPVQSGGKLVYNGRSVKEAAAEGCDLRKMSQYVDQVDIHLPLLTVTETLDFAHKVSSCTYDPDRVDSTIALLGLDECKDTILGDAFVRGVSGGQKRRVTLGEMMVSDARMLFLDEYTNGLDTATSEDITRGLRQWCQETNGSIVATLQQPTPGLYSSFDKIVVLRDGHVVFDGPRDDVLPFFEAMGYRCPGDVDVCDFLVDVLSQPRLCLTRQRASGHSPTDTALVTSAGEPLVRVPGAAVSIAEMVQYYRESPLWARLQRELEPHFPTDDANTDKAVLVPLMASEADRACFGTGYVLPVSTLLHMVMERQAKLMYVVGISAKSSKLSLFLLFLLALFFFTQFPHPQLPRLRAYYRKANSAPVDGALVLGAVLPSTEVRVLFKGCVWTRNSRSAGLLMLC